MPCSHRLRPLIAAVLTISTLSACARPGEQSAAPSLRLAVDSASAPLTESLLNSYEGLYPEAALSLQQEARADALDAVRAGDVDAAIMLYPSDDSDLFSTPIGREMLVIIAHPDVDVGSLTRRDVRAIFAGQVTAWPSSDGSQPQAIHVIVPPATASTRLAFNELVMQGHSVSGSAQLAADGAQTLSLVAETPDSIGLTTGSVLDDSVMPLTYEGERPALSSARDNSYRLVTQVVFAAPSEPEGALRSFLDWVLSDEGQAVVERHMLSLSD